MPLLEYGAAEGLAYKHPYYEELRLNRERNNMEVQLKAKETAKNKALGDMFKFGVAKNPYDRTQLKAMNEKTIEAMGAIANSTDWENDPTVYGRLRQMSDSLVNNEFTINDQAYQTEKTKMDNALAKDPTIAKRQAYKDYLAQMDQYHQTGSVDGITENRKLPIWEGIEGFKDLNSVAAEYGGAFQALDYSYDSHWPGGFKTAPNEESLHNLAVSAYTADKEQIDQEYLDAGYEDPIEYIKDKIRANVKTPQNQGNPALSEDYLRSRYSATGGIKGAENTSKWDNDVINREAASNLSTEVLNKVLGSNVPILMIPTNDGKNPYKNIKGITGGSYTGAMETKHVGDGAGGTRKVKMFEYRVEIPYVKAQKVHGLLNSTILYSNDTGNDDVPDIYNPYNVTVETLKKTDGRTISSPSKSDKVVVVTGWSPIDIQGMDGYRYMYDSEMGVPAAQTYNTAADNMDNMYPIDGYPDIVTADGRTFYNRNTRQPVAVTDNQGNPLVIDVNQ